MLKHEGDQRQRYFHDQFVAIELPLLMLKFLEITDVRNQLLDLNLKHHKLGVEIDRMHWRAQSHIPVTYDAYGWHESVVSERLVQVTFRARFTIDGQGQGTYHAITYRQLPCTYTFEGVKKALRSAFEYLHNPNAESTEGAPLSDLMNGFVDVLTDDRIPPIIEALRTMGTNKAQATALARKVVVENNDCHDHDRLVNLALELIPDP